MGSLFFAVTLFLFFTALATGFFYWVVRELAGPRAARRAAFLTPLSLLLLGLAVIFWVERLP